MNNARPRLLVTPGDPAGIGPDVSLMAHNPGDVDCVLVADPEMLQARAQVLGISKPLRTIDHPRAAVQPGAINILPVRLGIPVQPGRPEGFAAEYCLECINLAADACLRGEADALVTGPVNKALINQHGRPFSGHTEYLADRAGVDRVVMLLACDRLRVALVTTHLPLRSVASAINSSDLRRVLEILTVGIRTLYGIECPLILVAGLNPHAGENGLLGSEETDSIAPAIHQCTVPDVCLEGPLPADTLFCPDNLDRADAFLCMYHDQGLPVLKALGFHQAINITLGLPYLRTSVDHGTAYSLAGTGQACPGSMNYALSQSARIIRRKLDAGSHTP